MFLTKKGNIFIPSYPADHTEASKVKEGEEVRATRARNVGHHRKGMALLQLGFSNQDTYDNFDIYRQVITIKGGFVEWVEGKDGVKYPFAMSLSFEKMGQKKFEEWYAAILTVISKETKLKDSEIENELMSFF